MITLAGTPCSGLFIDTLTWRSDFISFLVPDVQILAAADDCEPAFGGV